MKRSLVLAAALVPLVLACGPAAQLAAPSPIATAATSATATSAPSQSPTPAGSLTFTVATGSKAVVRVTEQLADRQDLSDAVLASEKVSGSFTLLADGTFSSDSKIVVDLTALASDNRNRDGFIKQNTLETGRFPQASFVPTKTGGLTLPLPASGDLSFTLTGQLTVHGVTKETTFTVTAKRAGSSLTVSANATPALRFGTFGMEQPRVFSVISIKDEIRLSVDLVATQSP